MLAWVMNLGFAAGPFVGGGGAEITGKLTRTSETWLTRVTTEWLLPFLIH